MVIFRATNAASEKWKPTVKLKNYDSRGVALLLGIARLPLPLGLLPEERGEGVRRRGVSYPLVGALAEEAREALREHWWEHSAPTPEVYFTDLMWDDANPMRVMTSPPYHIAGLGVAKKLCKSKTTVLFHKPEYVCKPCRKTDYCRYCYRLRILSTRGKTHLCQLRTR